MEAYLVPEKYHSAAASLIEKLRLAKDAGLPMIILATGSEMEALRAAKPFNIPESHLN